MGRVAAALSAAAGARAAWLALAVAAVALQALLPSLVAERPGVDERSLLPGLGAPALPGAGPAAEEALLSARRWARRGRGARAAVAEAYSAEPADDVRVAWRVGAARAGGEDGARESGACDGARDASGDPSSEPALVYALASPARASDSACVALVAALPEDGSDGASLLAPALALELANATARAPWAARGTLALAVDGRRLGALDAWMGGSQCVGGPSSAAPVGGRLPCELQQALVLESDFASADIGWASAEGRPPGESGAEGSPSGGPGVKGLFPGEPGVAVALDPRGTAGRVANGDLFIVLARAFRRVQDESAAAARSRGRRAAADPAAPPLVSCALPASPTARRVVGALLDRGVDALAVSFSTSGGASSELALDERPRCASKAEPRGIAPDSPLPSLAPLSEAIAIALRALSGTHTPLRHSSDGYVPLLDRGFGVVLGAGPARVPAALLLLATATALAQRWKHAWQGEEQGPSKGADAPLANGTRKGSARPFAQERALTHVAAAFGAPVAVAGALAVLLAFPRDALGAAASLLGGLSGAAFAGSWARAYAVGLSPSLSAPPDHFLLSTSSALFLLLLFELHCLAWRFELAAATALGGIGALVAARAIGGHARGRRAVSSATSVAAVGALLACALAAPESGYAWGWGFWRDAASVRATAGGAALVAAAPWAAGVATTIVGDQRGN